jgi:hypothetical protein
MNPKVCISFKDSDKRLIVLKRHHPYRIFSNKRLRFLCFFPKYYYIYVVSYLNYFIRLFAIYFNLFLTICKKIRCSSLEIENSYVRLFAKKIGNRP